MTSERKGFPGGSTGKDSACNVGDLGSIPRLGRSPRERNGYPLQYSGLENSRTIQSMESQRAGRNWETFTFTFTMVFWLFILSTLWISAQGLKKHRLTREALNYSRVLPVSAENNWPHSLRTRNLLTQMPSFILLEIKAFCKTGRCNFQAGSYPIIFSTIRRA